MLKPTVTVIRTDVTKEIEEDIIKLEQYLNNLLKAGFRPQIGDCFDTKDSTDAVYINLVLIGKFGFEVMVGRQSLLHDVILHDEELFDGIH